MDVDVDETVETSDFEEQEEIEASRSPYWQNTAQDIHRRADDYSPRKRVKVIHNHIEKPPHEALYDSSLISNTPSGAATPAAPPASGSLLPTPIGFLNRSHTFSGEAKADSPDPLLLGGTVLQHLDEPGSGIATPQTRSVSPPLLFPSSPSPDGSVRSRSHDPPALFGSPPFVREQLAYVVAPGLGEPDDVPARPRLPVEISSPPSLSPTSPHPQRPILAGGFGEPHSSPMHPGQQGLGVAVGNSQSRTSGVGDEEHSRQTGRYPLRQRQARQLQPYLHDRLTYQKALRKIPDAIVSARSLQHQRGHPDDYQEESQETGQQSDEQDETQSVRHPSRAPESDGRDPNLGGMLEDLPSTDEEEDRQMRALCKEARKMLRERRAKEIEAAKRAKRQSKKMTTTQQKIKRFPLSKTYFSVDKSPHKSRRASTGSDSLAVNQCDATSPPSSPARATLDLRSSPSSFKEPRGDILRNSRETAIPVSDHDDDDNAVQTPGSTLASLPRRAESSSSSSNESSPTEALDRKSRRALNRMIPASMVNKLYQETASPQPKVRQRSVMVSSDGDEVGDVPLLPGQTRVRKGVNSGGGTDIRGDTESEDASCSDEDIHIEVDGYRRGPSIPLGFHSQRRSQRPTPHDVVENLSGGDDEISSSSESGLDDGDIQAYLDGDSEQHGGRGGNRHPREESLIDWMLTRTRTVGGNRRRAGEKKGKRASGGAYEKSRYKIDIATNGGRGYGVERQTLLNFGGHKRKRSGTTIQHDHTIRPPEGREQNAASSAVAHGATAVEALSIHNSKKSRKEKERERKKHAQTHGLYTFTASGVHLTSGRQRTVMTVDIEDEGFHRALAPLSQDWAKAPPTPPILRQPTSRLGRTRSAPREEDDAFDEPMGENNRSGRQERIRGDLNIPMLHSGYSFGTSTYIGKGWLHELVSIVLSTADPTLPVPPATSCFGLASEIDITEFSDSLEKICDDLLEFATGIPEDDHPGLYEGWHIRMRVVCQLASWLFIGASEGDSTTLRGSIRKNVTKLVKCFRDLALVKASLDMSTFMACWFAVELSARLKDQSSWSGSAEDCCLKDAVGLLVQYLLIYGLQDSILPIRDHEELDSLTLPQYTAELWIRLFHLLDKLTKPNNQGGKEFHAFWQVVKADFQNDGVSSLSSVEASETIWKTIFSLSALSQFSVHGMVTGTVRLPACWELVIAALKRIRLAADPVADRQLTESTLDKRDEYIGLIAARCFHLWDRWKWRLDDASAMLNQLVEIYRSRKFANLRHEPADFPRFILHSNWDSLSRYESTDTAFALFLKLIVQAARSEAAEDDPPKPDLSAKVKKLLSLAIPVGSLPFTKSHPPTVHDLSMLYNRLSAVVIGIHLSPTQHISRILHARKYIHFPSADDTTRIAIIRGMMNTAVIMVGQRLPLDAINEWCVDMANALFEEYKKMPKAAFEEPTDGSTESRQDPTIIARDRLHFSIQVLIGSIRRIVQAYKQIPEYPDPNLLSSLRSIIRVIQLNRVLRTTFEIRRLFESVLEIRILVMPTPPRPRMAAAVVDTNPDSQDYFGTFDIDMNDPELIAALGDEVESPERQNRKAKDAALSEFIESTNLLWIFWRTLSASTQGIEVTNKIQGQNYEAWLGCWLSCVDILIRNSNTKSWTTFLDLWDDLLKNVASDPLRRWIDLACLSKVLALDPLTYTTFTTRYLGLVFETLASTGEAREDTYLSMILSIDRRSHPLFNNVLPGHSAGASNDDISADEFPRLRRPLIQGIFSNLNQLIRDEAHGDPSLAQTNQEYISLCIRMFSTMKGTCLGLVDKPEKRRQYIDWCTHVFQDLQEYEHIRSQPRILYWLNWQRSLT